MGKIRNNKNEVSELSQKKNKLYHENSEYRRKALQAQKRYYDRKKKEKEDEDEKKLYDKYKKMFINELLKNN